MKVCVVYAGVRGFLDNVVTSESPKFEEKFLAFLKESHPKIIEDKEKKMYEMKRYKTIMKTTKP